MRKLGRLCVVSTGALVLSLAGATGDPWVGKPAGEIEALLGPAAKVSTAKDGGETWTYRLHRVKDPAAAAASAYLIADVPGVGLVARLEPPFPADAPDIPGPTELDAAGRATSHTGEQAASATWSKDTKTGEFERDWDPADLARVEGLAGKVKLVFVLDARRHIAGWSVTPKARRQDIEGTGDR